MHSSKSAKGGSRAAAPQGCAMGRCLPHIRVGNSLKERQLGDYRGMIADNQRRQGQHSARKTKQEAYGSRKSCIVWGMWEF